MIFIKSYITYITFIFGGRESEHKLFNKKN